MTRNKLLILHQLSGIYFFSYSCLQLPAKGSVCSNDTVPVSEIPVTRFCSCSSVIQLFGMDLQAIPLFPENTSAC